MNTTRDCQQCAALADPFSISSPAQLSTTIRQLGEQIALGVLRDVTPAHSPFGPFADLPLSAPWPDYIERHLQCTSCGKTFMLAIDTYHGGPGIWQTMPG